MRDRRRLGSQPSERLTRTAAEVPRTRPDASRACTAKYSPPRSTATVLSRPRHGALATVASPPGRVPESTRHRAIAVAPFQLAETRVTAPERAADAAGRPPGLPVHRARKAR